MDSEFLKQLEEMAEADFSDEGIRNAVQTSNQLEKMVAREEIQMPAYLKEQMINRINQPDIQAKESARKISKKLELFIFSCKVTAVVAASLVIMIAVGYTQVFQGEHSKLSSSEKEMNMADNIVEQLDKGSDNVINWFTSVSDHIMENDITK